MITSLLDLLHEIDAGVEESVYAVHEATLFTP